MTKKASKITQVTKWTHIKFKITTLVQFTLILNFSHKTSSFFQLLKLNDVKEFYVPQIKILALKSWYLQEINKTLTDPLDRYSNLRVYKSFPDFTGQSVWWTSPDQHHMRTNNKKIKKNKFLSLNVILCIKTNDGKISKTAQ